MSAIISYIKERFPIPSVLLFAFGYATFVLGVSDKNIWRENTHGSIINLLLLSSVFFFFLLRQRAIDEFRDADHDLKYFPDRPVQRGLVTKKQVMFLGLSALVLEMLSALLVGQKTIGFYILFLFYSFLMAKEFFAAKWLNKHFTLYFLVHEVIFLLLGLFFVSALNPDILRIDLRTFILLVSLTAAPMSIEVIRKFKPRYDKSGKAVADTYSTVWGRHNALFVLIVLSLIVGISLFLLKYSFLYLLFSFIIISSWLIKIKSNTAITLIGVINFLGFALLANIL